MPEQLSLSDLKIFIDPGHGGPVERPDISGSQLGTAGYHGHFAESNNIYEKDVVLDISTVLANLLAEQNVEIEMSRTTDTPVSLQERVNMAQNFGADIFVSVHINATGDPDVGGTEVLYAGQEDNVSRSLAEVMSEQISNTLGTENRGAKLRDDVFVLRRSKMTAVMAEAVFFTNPDEEEMILQPENQILVAEAIVQSLEIHVAQFQEFYKLKPYRKNKLARPLFLIPVLGQIPFAIYYFYFRRED